MQLRNVTLADFEESVSRVNALYDGNLAVHPDAHSQGKGTVGRLWVSDSSGVGARTSWSGRKCKAACWHAFRDVIRDILAHNERAVIITALARYTVDNFEDTYPETGNQNIGSMMCPAYMPELCDC